MPGVNTGHAKQEGAGPVFCKRYEKGRGLSRSLSCKNDRNERRQLARLNTLYQRFLGTVIARSRISAA